MCRVHAVLFDLHPVAGPNAPVVRNESVVRSVKVVGDSIVHGEDGLFIRWPHIGEHEALVLKDGIGSVVEPVFQRAVGRLSRGLQNFAVHIVQPAVVAASYPLLANLAELQRGASVATVKLQQAHIAAMVAEQDQVLSENPDG